MINEENLGIVPNYVINQQLFSAVYLQELSILPSSTETIVACRQTIQEWRDAYTNLNDDITRQSYVRQCLSALGLSYENLQSTYFILFSDQIPVGACLVVNDENIGRAIKGKHYQFQLIKYLREQSLQWGILTNGKNWRLCYANAAAPYEVFFEVELDGLLHEAEVQNFALFYQLFSHQAFTLQESSITTSKDIDKIGLDIYLAESEKRAEVIQRYLRSSVEHILQSLCLGFVQDEAAGSYTRQMLDEIYRNAIYLLYRILFVFYAEARELLPVQHPDYQQVSIASILEEACRYVQEGIQSEDIFSLWKRLTELFVIVDDGKPELEIRPYNGGLFSDKENPYLKKHKISNSHLAIALFSLGYRRDKSGFQCIDYADLSIRHLGTLYEGLLEYRLNLVDQERVVVREGSGKRSYISFSQAKPVKRTETVLEIGQVYFADDKGERKSSGSYYTPEDVVQYIIIHTVQPKLQYRFASFNRSLATIHSELAIALNEVEKQHLKHYADDKLLETIEQKILSIRILDPAMGSAHFLVAAGQCVTNFIVEALNVTEWVNDTISSDALIWKRRVVERCLYGVDINPLAQELAKLVLWLNSASLGKPLTFLDHHLKIGNSLYNAPLNQLDNLPKAKQESKHEIFQQLRNLYVQDMVGKLRYIIGTDSDDIAEVKYKGDVNKSVQDSMQRICDVANVWLASLFDLKNDHGRPINQEDYLQLVQELTQNYTPEEWKIYRRNNSLILTAQKIADQESFFHWEIEFPDAVIDGQCQFDVIIANPPYVGNTPNRIINTLYKTAKCGDLFGWIFELSMKFAGATGFIGMIVPLSLMFSRSMRNVRALLLESKANTYISAFDATRDGIFQPNGESRNGQRASIVIQHKDKKEKYVYTTNLMRWLNEDRSQLISGLRYADITAFATSEMLPKLGDSRLVEFFGRLRSYNRTIGSTLYSTKKSVKEQDKLPPSVFHYAYVPSTARYFITALPFAMRSTGVNAFAWEDQWTRDIAIITLNSNVFYWFWCALGDGFHVTGEVINAMVLLDVPKDHVETKQLYEALMNASQECVTYHKKWGEQIPNYNFNKRMDILLDIDEWFVRQVAPDMNLPRDIFAQYKSNSFLRPLDLTGIAEVEELLAEEI